jgi:hypothetical protein
MNRLGLDDAAVIEASRAEPDRFASLFDRHARHIHRYLARRVGARRTRPARPGRPAADCLGTGQLRRGRPGIGVVWHFEGSKAMNIFAGGTYAYLGMTTWGEQGQVGGDSLVQTAIVSRAGELP